MKLKMFKNPKTTADIAYNIVVQSCEFYKDENGESYLIHYNGTGYDLKYLSYSTEVKEFINKLFIQKYNRTIKSSDVKTAYTSICSMLDSNVERVPVFTHIAVFEDKIYYDLINDNNEVIVIDAESITTTTLASVKNLYFHRTASLCEQKKPVVNQNYGIREFVEEFLNVDKGQRLLFLTYICTAFIPNIQHPIFIVEGEKGSGKSTLFRYLLSIINPVNKDVMGLPKSNDDIVIALHNNYLSAFDNIGKIDSATSNILCQAVTGGTIVKRKLYTDSTEVSLNIKRLVALNGIKLELTQSDLLDRAILINLKRIDTKKRIPDTELFDRFDEVLPYVLADIFRILSKAMNIIKNAPHREYPRMADFSKYGYCVAEAIKLGYGEKFVQQYEENENNTTEMAIEQNPLLESLREFAESEGFWKGTMTELLKKLRDYCRGIYIGGKIPVSFPEKANALSKKLNLHKHEIANMGITVEIGRNTNRYVVIEKIRDKQSTIPTDEANSITNREVLLNNDEE